MSGRWRGSNRKARLPSDWLARRVRRLVADGYRCTWPLLDGSRCVEVATDVDHIVPNDDHSHENLQSLCGPHHADKSSREGNAARRAKKSAVRLVPDEHPGYR